MSAELGADLTSDPAPVPLAEPGGDDLPALAAALRVELGRLNRQLRQHAVGGLTGSQLSALAALDRHGALRLGELARVEAVSPPTLTKIVGGLEAEGYVTRTPDPGDRRSALVALTRKGRSELNRNRGQRTAFLVDRLHRLDPEERRVLVRAVELLARVTHPVEGEGDVPSPDGPT
jgi:DNA-binding MarR family transcriptional regulator